jgi:hypothetical protein
VIYGPPIDFSDVRAEKPITKRLLAAVSERLMRAIQDLKERAESGESAPLADATRPADSADERRRPPNRPDEVSRDRPTVLRA